jgi:hypothetical protein
MKTIARVFVDERLCLSFLYLDYAYNDGVLNMYIKIYILFFVTTLQAKGVFASV